MSTSSTNVANDKPWRFKPGNKGGPGNPYARRVARIRAMILDAVSDDDLKAVVGKLVEQAKAGDAAAIRELLTRLVGKPTEAPDPTAWTNEDTIGADTIESHRRLKREQTPDPLDDLWGGDAVQ